MVEEHRLPLPYVAQIIIVQQDDFNRGFLFHDGSELLQVHLQTTITHKDADRAVRATKRRSDGCRQSKAHRAHSSGSNHAPFLGELEVTARHHLVLSHICHQYGFVVGRFAHGMDDFAHVQRSFRREQLPLDDLVKLSLFIRGKTLNPFRMSILLHQFGQ